MRLFVRCHFILKRMTANFDFHALSLNLSHQLAFNQYNLTGSLLPCSSYAKSLNHQKLDTALSQPDHRLIHEINNPPADIFHRTADPYTNISFFHVCDKLSLAAVVFKFTSFENVSDDFFFYPITDKEIISPGL